MTAITKGQMDLFGSIFGEESVTEEASTTTAAGTTASVKTTAPTSKSGTSTTAAKRTVTPPPIAKEPEPPIKVHGDWKVDFYGNSFDVSDYVDEIPEEGIEIEVLREEMQKDFFGLSKERAYWEVDEENEYIFIFQKGTSKGAQ